ncbi:unannotated protein [freshwater metagenome]|uniref:Unannotated protein n=1 Tax=freshwater metagenome TaxID=449393 RepID=A0A6J6BQX2_9ZZZZ
MVSVLPEPAPAITTAGSSGLVAIEIIALCSAVGSKTLAPTFCNAAAISCGEYFSVIRSPPVPHFGLGNKL